MRNIFRGQTLAALLMAAPVQAGTLDCFDGLGTNRDAEYTVLLAVEKVKSLTPPVTFVSTRVRADEACVEWPGTVLFPFIEVLYGVDHPNAATTEQKEAAEVQLELLLAPRLERELAAKILARKKAAGQTLTAAEELQLAQAMAERFGNLPAVGTGR